MALATLPRSAQFLAEAARPTLADARRLRRIAEQDVHERARLADLAKAGAAVLGGSKDERQARMGILNLALGRFGDAEECLAGKDAYTKALMGLLQAAVGDTEEAIKELTAAGATFAEAKLELARVLLDDNKPEEAAKILEDAPHNSDWHHLRGRFHEATGNTEGALQEYEASFESDAENVENLFKLGVLLDRIGDDEMATEYYLRCADVSPPYLPGVINLGVLYDERGEANAAMDCFRQVLAFNPNHRRARLLLRDSTASRSMFYDEHEERERERMEKILKTPVNDFELSVRSRNCLAKMNIFTLGDLISITEQEMLNYKNFGETSLKEVKDMLNLKGLRLGMLREGEDRSMSKADQKVLGESVDKLELTSRSNQVLEQLGATRVGDVVQYTDLELYRAPGSGQSVAQELSTALGAVGLFIKRPTID